MPYIHKMNTRVNYDFFSSRLSSNYSSEHAPARCFKDTTILTLKFLELLFHYLWFIEVGSQCDEHVLVPCNQFL
jgi:hypothetical protein